MEKMEYDPQIKEASRWYFVLVRERFDGGKAETYRKFRALVEKYAPHAENGSIEILFSEVKALFAGHEDLIQKFGYFVDYYRKINDRSSSVEANEDRKTRSGQEKNQSHENAVKTSVDFLNNVRRMVKEPKLFKSLIKIITDFRKHRSLDQVKEEAFELLKKNPALMLELSGFLAEAMGKKSGKSKAEKYKALVLDCEKAMHKSDLWLHRILSVKESAERLISENSDMDESEIIDIRAYFSALNIRCVKKKLKGCRHLLLNRFKFREKAIKASKRIVRFSEKKIEELTMFWSPEKKQLFWKNHEEESQIPVFDWRDRDEDECRIPVFDWL